MSEAGAPIARFDFVNGLLRGSHLTLYSNCVVHRSDSHLETVPLASVAAARVAFDRNPTRLGLGLSLIIIALILYGISAPLGSFAAAQAGDMAGPGAQGVARALHALFRLLELLASLLPVAALALALGGLALGVLGWLGSTTLTLALAGHERSYPARGRNTQLLDFAEVLAAQLMALKR
jgi:hypothetical protein